MGLCLGSEGTVCLEFKLTMWLNTCTCILILEEEKDNCEDYGTKCIYASRARNPLT